MAKRDSKQGGYMDPQLTSIEQSEENVREDEEGEIDNVIHPPQRVAQSETQKKSLKEIARKLWLAVEVGDKIGSLQILKSQTQS